MVVSTRGDMCRGVIPLEVASDSPLAFSFKPIKPIPTRLNAQQIGVTDDYTLIGGFNFGTITKGTGNALDHDVRHASGLAITGSGEYLFVADSCVPASFLFRTTHIETGRAAGGGQGLPNVWI